MVYFLLRDAAYVVLMAAVEALGNKSRKEVKCCVLDGAFPNVIACFVLCSHLGEAAPAPALTQLEMGHQRYHGLGKLGEGARLSSNST